MTDTATTTATTRPHADIMRGVIPYLNLRGNAGKAADFYAHAFGATDLGRMPHPEKPGQFMHLQIEINGGALMMTDHVDAGEAPRHGLDGAHMQLVVGDGKQWWARAIEAGCREVSSYGRQFWGDDWGLLEDPFGIQWGILEPGPADKL